MAKLFDFALYPRIAGTERLYYRKSAEGVTFDTYFNGISIKKLRKYTTVQELQFSQEVEILTEQGRIKSGACVKLDEVPENADMLYVKTAEMPTSLTVNALGKTREVYPAILICTYHRVGQVKENIDYILTHLRDISFSIILVDNASEIPTDTWNDSRVTVLHHINNGGSGGFAYAMKYAAERGGFTHLLLMDDDVSVDRVTLQKLFGFLSFLKDKYADLCVSGAMLYADEPTVQFECGGYFGTDGKQIGYGYRFELTEREKLLLNERENTVNYGGWWMFCMPVRYCLKGEYPAPFFVKYDDVEYALRCKLNIITLGGVGVWHESFANKYNSVHEYFNTRNYLFLRKWHTPNFTDKQAFKTVRYLLLEKLCRQQYKMAEAVLAGYEDFLKGDSYLERIDYGSKLPALKKLNYTILTEDEIESQYGIKFERSLYRKCSVISFKRYMQPLLYGHMIPGLFCRPLTITDVFQDRKEHYFGAGKTLHYNIAGKCGYITTKNIIVFLRTIIQFINIKRKRAKK